ncbi:uncharacterized protein LOC101846601 [Aplysia californica]|uniref:Uncharacterized protein LOC101846601 n=1 Tax=Aplysia californica TaxID=6500 RepID=A0ABM0JZC9_APLCA|nr:uncharacterized protein LOC101846601 [Aplysia californica]
MTLSDELFTGHWNSSADRCPEPEGESLQGSFCDGNFTESMSNVSGNLGEIEGSAGWWLDTAVVLAVVQILKMAIIPAVSILGAAGNLISVLVISKSGLRKTSNILLFALSAEDASFLIGVNNIPFLLYTYVDGDADGWHFSESISHALYCFYFVFAWFQNIGLWCSMTILAFMTIERLLAIFFPLKFRIIVTPFRTWTTLLLMLLYYNGSFAFGLTWHQFYYFNRNTTSFGIIGSSTVINRQKNKALLDALETVLIVTTGILPLSIVISWSVIISFKVARAARQRKTMTSSSSSSSSVATRSVANSRTTRTLLTVCVVYSITGSFHYIIDEIFTLTISENVEVQLFQALKKLSICINSACNFLIYVTTNKDFRMFLRRSLFKGMNGAKSDGKARKMAVRF